MPLFKPRGDGSGKSRAYVAGVVASALILAVLLVLASPVSLQAQEQEEDSWQLLKDVYHILNNQFHRPVDLDEFLAGALEGALAALGDPYTRYIPPDELTVIRDELDGFITGVGIVIHREGDQVVVVTPLAGTPAEEAGIRPGDVITAVDGQAVAGMSPGQVGSLIRGPEGTQVTLELLRDGRETLTLNLTRKRIHIPGIESKVLDGDIGYIRIIEFQTGVAEAMEIIHGQMLRQGVQYFVLDLRNNPGGLLPEALTAARVFLPEGPITHVQIARGPQQTYDADGGGEARPVAVLINRGTASAAEILAAAIAENDVGFLVGAPSYGKMTVQRLLPLPRGGGIQFTTGQYLTPLRQRIAGTGLTPDVPVPGADPMPVPDMSPLTGQWVLQQGDRGLEVQGLQQRLNWLGYDNGEADGYFGPGTAAALARFQREHGLAPTGRLDETVIGPLNKAVEDRARGVVPVADLEDPVVAAAVSALRNGFQRP